MRNWLVFTLLVAAAGCSKTEAPPAVAAAGNPAATAPVATPAPPPVEPARPRLTIPADSALRVRLDETVSTKQNNAGDTFTATLSRPVLVDGEPVIPVGTRFRGHLTDADASGRLKGRALIGLTLDSVHLNGKDYELRTNSVQRVGAAHKKRNALLIGGGAGLGAAIGAIAGGGKGAAIGAGAGAGGGTATAYATGKLHVTLPAETPLVFTTRAKIEF